MSDWRYDPTLHRWELTIGDWRATVTQAEQRSTWHTAVERVGSYHERYEGPDTLWPQDGRACSIAEIARRREAESGA